MSRQNNKTLHKHLAWLRATGKMSKWLETRLEWDEVTRNEILAEMFNRTPVAYDWVDWHSYLSVSNPRSSVKITGLGIPEGY